MPQGNEAYEIGGQRIALYEGRANIRIHFISRVPADHVLDGFISTWMVWEPWVNLQDHSIDNNYMSSIRNLGLDFVPRYDPQGFVRAPRRTFGGRHDDKQGTIV